MEIKARVALSLPNKFYRVELKYDTYEKATYDAYLIASVVKNAETAKAASTYIDEITGKGSLNPHFKKLYKEISKMTKKQIDGILNDSLYPITVVDKSHHFKYYEMLNVTRMDNKVYFGNLKDNEDLYKTFMPQDEQSKFLSIDFEVDDGVINKDMYDAIFSEKDIKINLGDDQYYPISKKDFRKVFEYDNDFDSIWMPKIGSEITSGNWNVLSKSIVDSWEKNFYAYLSKTNNLVAIDNEYIKITEVINVFDLYFYKETRYDFSLGNSELLEEAIDYLFDSKKINEFRTKSLIAMLSVVSEKTAQKTVQFWLGRKDSKEMADLGLKLIKSGLEKDWEEETLKSIKKSISKSDYLYLYRINSNLGFELTDLLDINDNYLTEEDRTRKHAYLAEKKNMLDEIRKMLGDMSVSGVREKLKKLQKDDVVNSVKQFLNEYQGHNDGRLLELNFDGLKKEYEKIKTMYKGNYQKIKNRCDKLESD